MANKNCTETVRHLIQMNKHKGQNFDYLQGLIIGFQLGIRQAGSKKKKSHIGLEMRR